MQEQGDFSQRNLVDLSKLSDHPIRVRELASSLQRAVAFETIFVRGIDGAVRYGPYFSTFWIYGLTDPERGRIIKSGYFWLRHIDDIADGEKPVPTDYNSRKEYLERRREIVSDLASGRTAIGDKQDILLLDYLLTAKRLGFDLTGESLAILDTMIIDEERSRTGRLLTQQELTEYYDKLDYACIDGAFKVAGEGYTSRDLEDLSMAIRTRFNLHDLTRDLKAGIINVSKEDIARYGIDLAMCARQQRVEQLFTYEPMRSWYGDQVAFGWEALQRAKDKLRVMCLKWQTRFALDFVFAKPAEKTFRRYQGLLASS